MNLLPTLLLTLLVTTVKIYSQTSCACDLADKLNAEFRSYYEAGQYKEAFQLADQVEESEIPVCKAIAKNWQATVHIAMQDFRQARTSLAKEMQLLQKLNCNERLAKHYSSYASFYNHLNLFDSAVYVSLKGLHIAEEGNLPKEQIKICANLGALFNQLGQNDKSVSYNKKGVNIARSISDTASLAMILNQLSNNYLFISHVTGNTIYSDSALSTANEALLYSRYSGHTYFILESFGNISMSYSLKGNYPLCIAYADSIIENAKISEGVYYRNISIAYVQKSDSYLEMNDFYSSLQMADSAYYYGKLFNIQLTLDPLHLIYLSSKALKNYEKALWAHETMSAIQDSLFTMEKNTTIAELDGKYNQEKNERRIEKLNQQKRFYLLLSVTALLFIVIVIFYFRQQSLKQKQKQLETEQRLNRARINPHFFFNILTSLQFLATKEENKKKLLSSFYSFSKLMRQSLESTYDEMVSIEREIEFITHYLSLQELKREGLFTYEIKIDEFLSPSEIQIPAMIIQPFLENSIEHGFKNIEKGGVIQIDFKLSNQKLIIYITDNGSGLQSKTHEKEHISRATQITRDRLYLINKRYHSSADFNMTEMPNKGMKVEIILPLITIP